MKLYRETELKDVLIGGPILEAKQGTRTSNSYATFPNDYEGGRIYLKPIEITEEEIHDILINTITVRRDLGGPDEIRQSTLIDAAKAILNLLKEE